VSSENRDDDKTRSFAAGADGSEDAKGDNETRTFSDDRTAGMESRGDSDRISDYGTLRAGTEVLHYTIVDHVGAGGMGEVYLAQDNKLSREVALKFLAPRFVSDENFKARFRKEAQAAAQLNHPNVVTIYEVGDFDGSPYLVMEYVKGQSLADIIRGSGASLDDIVSIAIQICEGVKEAHTAGIVHRDLKPENIKMTESGRMKILDFGLAKKLGADSVDEKGRIEGTLYYMSPEQVTGSDLSFSTDIFSYGVVLYELFTGRRPFKGKTSANVIYSILHEDPDPPWDLNPDLPGWVNVMLLKLLSKNPEDRFRDMVAVGDFLQSARGDDAGSLDVGFYKTRKRTVTVIDLRNLSGDESWDYFCEGFTEDLIREISRRTDLVVSAEPAGSEKCDVRAVFRRCRSDYAVMGTLMRWQDNIKLSLSCYGEGGDDLFFGEEYEGKSENLFSLLSDAAVGASSALAAESGSSPIPVDEDTAMDVSAYDYYLKGRKNYHSNKPEDLDFAAGMFAKALELDARFALAHSGLSDIYSTQYMAYYVRTPECLEHAKKEAEKALDIDPNLPEVHRSMGRYHMFAGDLLSAEKSFLKAIEISPKYFLGYRTMAWLKEMQGDHDSALQWAKKSLELAPTDLETLLLLSLLYIDGHKYTLAMATLQRAIEIGPDYGRAYYNLGNVYMKLGVLDLAAENLLLAIKYHGDPNSCIDAGYVFMVSCDYDSAEIQFQQSVQEGYLPFIAFHYLGLMERLKGEPEIASQYFKRAIDSARACKELDPDNPTVLSYEALALAGAGEVAQAESILTGLAGRFEQDGDILYNIARCYALIGNKAKSDEFRSRAICERAGPTERELQIDPHFSKLFPN
jgi:serine/threonine protein kinase/Tfp pilus assembly protein PilF